MTAKRSVSKTSSLPKKTIKDAIVRHLHCSLGTDENKADNHAWWKARMQAVLDAALFEPGAWQTKEEL